MKKTTRSLRSRRNYQNGQWAEYLAVVLLQLKGYRIVARRKRTPFGEIDIAALKHDTLVIVEVKQRGSLYASHAAITSAQRQRLYSAAQYVAGHMAAKPTHIRCDAILLGGLHWPTHIRNAF